LETTTFKTEHSWNKDKLIQWSHVGFEVLNVGVAVCNLWTISRPRGIVFSRTREPVISQQQHETPSWNSLDNDGNCDHEYDIKDESGQTESFSLGTPVWWRGFLLQIPRNHVGCWSSGELSTKHCIWHNSDAVHFCKDNLYLSQSPPFIMSQTSYNNILVSKVPSHLISSQNFRDGFAFWVLQISESITGFISMLAPMIFVDSSEKDHILQ
jgi:hypothetical protein